MAHSALQNKKNKMIASSHSGGIHQGIVKYYFLNFKIGLFISFGLNLPLLSLHIFLHQMKTILLWTRPIAAFNLRIDKGSRRAQIHKHTFNNPDGICVVKSVSDMKIKCWYMSYLII